MEIELLKQLLTDPARLPFILLLAVAIVFVLKIINVAAEALAKHLSDKVRQRKGVLSLCKGIAQVIAIAIIIYVANATYWNHAISNLLPSPTKKPIISCEATVELLIESDDRDTTYRHFMDSGGYMAFYLGNQALLTVTAPDSWGQAIGTNKYLCKGTFKMNMTDSASGKPVDMLRRAEYLQIKFPRLPDEYNLVRGKAICVINNEVRFELELPPQRAKDGKVYMRDLTSVRQALK